MSRSHDIAGDPFEGHYDVLLDVSWHLTGMQRFRISRFRRKLIAQVQEKSSAGIRWRDARVDDLHVLATRRSPPPKPKK